MKLGEKSPFANLLVDLQKFEQFFEKSFTDMSPAGTQNLHSLADFFGQDESLFVGNTENANRSHYVETDRFRDMPRANLVNE